MKHFNFQTLSEVLAQNHTEPEWIWTNRLARGCCSILAGKAKAGKSTFVRALASAVTNGKPFLGGSTIAAKVVYVSLEDHARFAKRIYQNAECGGGENLFLHIGPIRSAPATIIAEELKVYCERMHPGLIVIDPLFRAVISKDANDYVETTRITEPFLRLARDLNAHVMLVHHARKGESTGFEGSLGSMGLLGGVDDNLMLESRGRRSVLLSRGRYIDPSKTYFRSEGGSLHVCQPGDGRDEMRTAVLEALQDRPLSRQALAEVVGGRTEDLTAILRELQESGNIAVEGAGRRGSPLVFRFLSHPPNQERETNSGGLE